MKHLNKLKPGTRESTSSTARVPKFFILKSVCEKENITDFFVSYAVGQMIDYKIQMYR
jgi:hypothetical protein